MAENSLTPDQQEIADMLIKAIVDKAPAFISMPKRSGRTTILRYVEAEIDRRKPELLRQFEDLRIRQAEERGRQRRADLEAFNAGWLGA